MGLPVSKYYPFEDQVLDVLAVHQLQQSVYGGIQVTTLPSSLTGSLTSTGGSTTLISSGATFVTSSVAVGDLVANITDGSIAVVKSVDSETQLTTTALLGGSDNTWTSGDSYSVRTAPGQIITLTQADGANDAGIYIRSSANDEWTPLGAGGGGGWDTLRVQTLSGNITLTCGTDAKYQILQDGGASRTITLDKTTLVAGTVFIITNDSAYNSTFSFSVKNGSGGAEITSMYAGNTCSFITDGTNWYSIDDNSGNTDVNKRYTTAYGSQARANSSQSSAYGYNSQSTGWSTVAEGYWAVASGSQATAIGHSATASGSDATATGKSASAAGTSSTANGWSASAAATNTTAIGHAATAQTSWDTALGKSANAQGGSSVGIGQSSSASGTTAVSIGYQSSVNAPNSVAVGRTAQSWNSNFAYIFSKGYYSAPNSYGDECRNVSGSSTQQNLAIDISNAWYGNTSNGTETEVYLHWNAGSRFLVLATSIVAFEIVIAARSTTTGNCSTWKVTGAIKRDGSSNTALVWSVTKSVMVQDAGASGWDVSVTADDTNEALVLKVTGASSNSIRWVGRIQAISTKF